MGIPSGGRTKYSRYDGLLTYPDTAPRTEAGASLFDPPEPLNGKFMRQRCLETDFWVK